MSKFGELAPFLPFVGLLMMAFYLAPKIKAKFQATRLNQIQDENLVPPPSTRVYLSSRTQDQTKHIKLKDKLLGPCQGIVLARRRALFWQSLFLILPTVINYFYPYAIENHRKVLFIVFIPLLIFGLFRAISAFSRIELYSSGLVLVTLFGRKVLRYNEIDAIEFEEVRTSTYPAPLVPALKLLYGDSFGHRYVVISTKDGRKLYLKASQYHLLFDNMRDLSRNWPDLRENARKAKIWEDN